MSKKYELEKLKGETYSVPNQLYRACENLHQLAILNALFELNNNTCDPYPSREYLCMGLMDIGTVSRTIKRLVELGYLTKARRFDNSNIYHIEIENIKNAIRKKLPIGLVVKKMREEQLDEMAVQRVVNKPKLAHRAETLLNNAVISKATGENLNSVNSL